MVATNFVTFLSYVTICVTLLFLLRHTRRVIARDWAWFTAGFALFIVACGSTHLFDVITTWVPVFWAAAWANIVTAVLSAWVAVLLILRAHAISFGINDYASRLAKTEHDRLELQESLIAAQKLEEWSRLSAAVSHEIRGPLEAIQNLQHLIQTSDSVSPEVAGFARASAEEAAQVIAISDASLSLIRQARDREPIDIRAASDSVRVLLNPLIRQKSIVFTVQDQGNCVVEAYAGEVRQVLLNLLRNACEAVDHPGSRVTVTLNGREQGVQVTVADDGPGIPPAILPGLFEFGVTSKGSGGNGIGLWAVKHILTRHGGSISVDSALGKGARFDLWWPRAA
jgi:signal transduction histidine kinase